MRGAAASISDRACMARAPGKRARGFMLPCRVRPGAGAFAAMAKEIDSGSLGTGLSGMSWAGDFSALRFSGHRLSHFKASRLQGRKAFWSPALKCTGQSLSPCLGSCGDVMRGRHPKPANDSPPGEKCSHPHAPSTFLLCPLSASQENKHTHECLPLCRAGQPVNQPPSRTPRGTSWGGLACWLGLPLVSAAASKTAWKPREHNPRTARDTRIRQVLHRPTLFQ